MSLGDISQAESRSSFLLKQSANIYTMMLILAFVFIVIGCLFLFLEMKAYDFSVKVAPDAKVTQMAAPVQNVFVQSSIVQSRSERYSVTVSPAQDALCGVS